jgi:purine-nucleoside phosphorylase
LHRRVARYNLPVRVLERQERIMVADRKWVEKNLGFDPISTPPPPDTFSVSRVAKAAVKRSAKASAEDFQREIIDFDSEGPVGQRFFAFSTATGLSRFTDIPWPAGLAPKTGPKPKGTGKGPLPKADVLLVTWTVDEGHALSRVLTPGKDSRNDYVPYTHNFAKIAKKMRKGCPALQAKRLGAFWTTTIGKKSVVVFKSDSHMSQDGPQLPNIDVWRQLIREVKPKLVITTGTAGGIGKQFEVGDVIVSPIVRFDCTAKFKKQPFAQAHFSSVAAKSTKFAKAKALFKANSAQLPKANTRQPKIVKVAPSDLKSCVLTTDFFGFDTSDDHFKLQGLGDVSEMGDAILGLVASEMGAAAPRYLAIRNVSDPQIKAEGTIRQQAQVAASIYKGFGRWSSVCSAITCWASIVAEP